MANTKFEEIRKDAATSQFIKWCEGLKSWEKCFYVNKIALACDVSYVTVMRWSYGYGRIRKPYYSIINEIAGEEVIKMS